MNYSCHLFLWKEVSLLRRDKESLGLTGNMANRYEQAANCLKSKQEEGEKGRGKMFEGNEKVGRRKRC